ncbi:MAG: ankyrin repeat domain-containing protein [Tatlockia sp.]|nr:ankyrin repeat domain-containing protein [Tatlockia sp.]
MKNKIEQAITNYSNIPMDLWSLIFSDIDDLQAFRLTNSFFATNGILLKDHALALQKKIALIFDYRDGSIDQDKNFKSNLKLLPHLKHEYEEVQTMLLSKSFDATEIINAVFHSCRYGYIQNLKLLLEECKTNEDLFNIVNETQIGENNSPLGEAAIYGRKKIFSLLLDEGAQFVNGEIDEVDDNHLIQYDMAYCCTELLTPLHIIALQSDIKWLEKNFTEYPSLIEPLANKGYINYLKLILKNDHENLEMELRKDYSIELDKDIANWTLLHWASCLGLTECLKVLIKFGANIDAKSLTGNSSLQVACVAGNLDIIKLLYSSGAEVTLTEDNTTLLHLTAYHGHTECAEYLINEKGFDIEEENHGGDSPLYLATLKKNSDGMDLTPEKIANKKKCISLFKECIEKNPNTISM